MKSLATFFLLLFLSVNSYSQDKQDSLAIVQLLIDDYKTLGNWDIQSHINNCTDNYLLVENGEIWDMAKEREHFLKNSKRVLERKDHFDIHCIRVNGSFAYAVYYLKSDITENGILKTRNWIETSNFRKVKGEWKVEMIHSTPIER